MVRRHLFWLWKPWSLWINNGEKCVNFAGFSALYCRSIFLETSRQQKWQNKDEKIYKCRPKYWCEGHGRPEIRGYRRRESRRRAGYRKIKLLCPYLRPCPFSCKIVIRGYLKWTFHMPRSVRPSVGRLVDGRSVGVCVGWLVEVSQKSGSFTSWSYRINFYYFFST